MIVADASPLIFLGRLDLLSLLPELFGQVLVSPTVYSEATAARRPGALAVLAAQEAGFFEIVPVKNQSQVADLSELVDTGEAEALALALERGIERILMDDLAGRRLAKKKGLAPVGTLGVLVAASRRGYIEDFETVLDAAELAGLRMSPHLRDRVLALVR